MSDHLMLPISCIIMCVSFSAGSHSFIDTLSHLRSDDTQHRDEQDLLDSAHVQSNAGIIAPRGSVGQVVQRPA